MATKRNYLLDTSVCLSDSDAIFKFDNHDLFLPLKVLEEIDNHKKRQDSVGLNARNIIRHLDDLRSKGSLEKGVRLGKGKGLLRVMSYASLKDSDFPSDLDKSVPDHIIIATAKAVQSVNPERKTVLVSRDINMRVICDSIGITSEDYISEEAVSSSEELYTGFVVQPMDEQIIDRFYAGESIIVSEDEVDELWHPNQYVMMVSNSNEKKSALARFKSHHEALEKVIHKNIPDWNIESRNKEQAFALDLLMNPDIDIITLVGKAGSGKTLCAIAAALEQTMEGDNIYKRVIVSRPIQPMGKDIGYLPGTMEEKMEKNGRQ